MDKLNLALSEGHASRKTVSLAPGYDKYKHFSLAENERKYSRQFFSLYQHRLGMLKPRVDREAMTKWGHDTRRVDGQKIQHKHKILDIVSGELCWVLGTVFVEMKHKLKIMQDVEKGTDDVMPELTLSYIDETEIGVVMLEDESGRAILHNPELLGRKGLVTGCFVAVLGIEIQAGILEVMEVLVPTPAPQLPLPTTGRGSKLAFVSGLRFGADADADIRAVFLQQWLCGELGGEKDQQLSSEIGRLIICGDSVVEDTTDYAEKETSKALFGSKNVSRFKTSSFVAFNSWLAEVSALVPVSIMAGENDPAEACWPQQPFHRSLLGENTPYLADVSTTGSADAAISSLTNPTWLELDNGLRVLGSSGQNITDMLKYVLDKPTESSILDAMANTITWQNIAPTAPDTLYCYPYENKDPFTLDETPHLYFASNQPFLGSRKFELGNTSVTLVSVGDFRVTGDIMVVDTETLSVEKVLFVI